MSTTNAADEAGASEEASPLNLLDGQWKGEDEPGRL